MTTHVGLLQDLEAQFRPIFEHSPDGVYLWLDDAHKICNERLAAMFGYTVPEWRERPNFLDSFVAEDDQDQYGWNYQHRVAAFAFPVTFRFRGRRKDGSTFAAETDMIPISFQGHAVAYHFVRQVGV
ncbi:MAG: PAS domain-containing protein [Dehalococcoidia bacterium]